MGRIETSRPTILMIGDIGGPDRYHVGDEAIFTACVEWTKTALPECRLVAVSEDPQFTSRNLSIESIWQPRLPDNPLFERSYWNARLTAMLLGNLSRWLSVPDERHLGQIYSSLSAARLLYICGGGNLTSLFSGELRLRSVMALLALDMGIPVVGSGQTLGPHLTAADSDLMRLWLGRVEFLGVRDEQRSPAIARELGVDGKKIHVHPDDAYLLEPTEVRTEWLEKLRSRRREEALIGVSFHLSPADGNSTEELSLRLARLLDRVMGETTATILFIPHETSVGREAYDVAFARAVEKYLRSPQRFHVLTDFLSDREVKYLTGCCDLILSTRYHGIVFALSSGVPCVGLMQDEYTAVKMRGAFHLAGVPESVVDVWDPELDRKVLEFWKHRATFEASIAHNRDEIRHRIEAYQRSLSRVIGELVNGNELLSAQERKE
ncbi:MAG: polysaccharide pyruvyl transferase family protein [Vicinamibacteria bacterium]